jgi:hypothetical protein
VADHRVESCHIAVRSDDMAVSTATCTTSCRTLTAGFTRPVGLQCFLLFRATCNNDANSEFEPRLAGSGASRG